MIGSGTATSGRRSSTCAAPTHDLRVAVLDCDLGVGIVRKGLPESRLPYSEEQIEALDYADLAADRERLLNLKSPGYLDEFLASEAGSARSSG